MKLYDVVQIIEGLREAGIKVWVDGGWCVDALIGHELREHGDLDIAVSRPNEKALWDLLSAQGYTRSLCKKSQTPVFWRIFCHSSLNFLELCGWICAYDKDTKPRTKPRHSARSRRTPY